MSKHSPGPWREGNHCVYDANGELVFYGAWSLMPGSNNARLIIAAPTLLSRLRRAMERCGPCDLQNLPCRDCMEDTFLIESIEDEDEGAQAQPPGGAVAPSEVCDPEQTGSTRIGRAKLERLPSMREQLASALREVDRLRGVIASSTEKTHRRGLELLERQFGPAMKADFERQVQGCEVCRASTGPEVNHGQGDEGAQAQPPGAAVAPTGQAGCEHTDGAKAVLAETEDNIESMSQILRDHYPGSAITPRLILAALRRRAGIT